MTMKVNYAMGSGLNLNVTFHNKLLDACLSRLDWAASVQNPFRDQCAFIDKEINGHLILDEDDAKREKANERGHGVKPVDVKLPLIVVQLDEAITVVSNILAPTSGMYNAFATEESQKQAKGVSTLMNRHSKQFGHYQNLLRGIGNLFRYNICGWEVEWKEEKGAIVQNDQTGNRQIVNDVIRDGNEIKALSMYNTLWDPSVEIEQIGLQGEFYATIERKTKFGLQRMLQRKEIELKIEELGEIARGKKSYYRKLPAVRGAFKSQGGNIPDWEDVFTEGNSEKGPAFELVKLRIWLDPSDYKLSTRSGLEVWQVTILNGERIVAAKHLENAYGRLPCAFARALDDDFGLATRSYAENLIPFNRFSSHQFNIHQRSARRKLYGLTFYNEKMVPGLSDETVDISSGRIPVKDVEDINKVVKQVFDGPDTANTLNDIAFMQDLMQSILPTDMLKQVTSLERATKYQAAATVQGSDRRNYKIARTIDEAAWTPIRQLQYFNILLNQKAISIFDAQGKTIEINPSELRDAKLEFASTSGMSGMDKLIIAESIKEVATLLIQNKDAAEKFDVAAIINYWTSLLGDTTDFSQFLYENQFDALGKDEKDMAFQLLQQAIQQQQNQEGAQQQ